MVKLSLYSIWHHVMKIHEEVEVYLRAFLLTSILDIGELSALTNNATQILN
jgi:hypothetical protein